MAAPDVAMAGRPGSGAARSWPSPAASSRSPSRSSGRTCSPSSSETRSTRLGSCSVACSSASPSGHGSRRPSRSPRSAPRAAIGTSQMLAGARGRGDARRVGPRARRVPAFRSLVARASLLMEAVRFAVAFALMLLPTAFIGMAFPLVMRCVGASPSRFGRSVGLVYAVNTLGAVVGARSWAPTGFFPPSGASGSLARSLGALLLVAAPQRCRCSRRAAGARSLRPPAWLAPALERWWPVDLGPQRPERGRGDLPRALHERRGASWSTSARTRLAASRRWSRAVG